MLGITFIYQLLEVSMILRHIRMCRCISRMERGAAKSVWDCSFAPPFVEANVVYCQRLLHGFGNAAPCYCWFYYHQLLYQGTSPWEWLIINLETEVPWIFTLNLMEIIILKFCLRVVVLPTPLDIMPYKWFDGSLGINGICLRSTFPLMRSWISFVLMHGQAKRENVLRIRHLGLLDSFQMIISTWQLTSLTIVLLPIFPRNTNLDGNPPC